MPSVTVEPETAARASGSPGGTDPSRRPTVLAVAVGIVLAVSVGLRFVTRSELWLDEALTVNIARLPLGDLSEALRHDGAPPLYYVLLHGWMNVFGESDVAVRALSGVIGVATIPVAWFVGHRVGGRLVAWTTVVVVASSPYAIRYSTENRPYALQMLLVLLGYLALCRVLERPSLGRLVGVAAVTGLLLYTQYWSIYLLVVVGAGLVWQAVRAGDAGQRQAARSAIVAMIAGGLTFLPWLSTFLYQAANTGTPWGDPILPAAAFSFAAIGFAGGAAHSEAYVLLVPLVLLALLAVFGRAVDARRIELDVRTQPGVRVQATVLVITLVLGVMVSYLGGSTFDARYAAIVFPLFALVVAYGFTTFADARVRTIAIGGLVALSLVGGVRNVVEHRTQAYQVADVIVNEAGPGDVVAYCPDQVGPSTARLLEDEPGLTQLTFPDGAPPELIDWVDYQDRIDAADTASFAQEALALAGDAGTVWYVNAPGYRNFQDGDCEAIGAALGAARPGAIRVGFDNEFFEFQGLIEYPAP